MIKLLRANFCLMSRNVFFYLAVIMNTVMWVLFSSNDVFFDTFYLMLQPVFYSVFIAFFIGSEYGNGTFRNKLICGHTRAAVYFSYLIVSISAALISVLPGLVFFVYKNYAFLSAVDPYILVMILVGFILLNCVCCSVFTAIGFGISSRTVCVIAVTVVAFCGMVSAEYLHSKLLEPETVPDIIITEEHEVIENGRKPNPDYAGGLLRKLLIACFDAMSETQLIEYTECLSTWRMYSNNGEYDYDEYSGIGYKTNGRVDKDIQYIFLVNQITVFVLSSAAGYILFKRKNLK